MDKLYIIIPAYNEEENINDVAKQWHDIVQEFGGEGSKLVIIDDGSKDDTFAKLEDLKSNLSNLVVLTKPNSGHGATLLYGYEFSLDNNADYIFQTDSDGQTLPSEFSEFWINRENYKAQIGYRNSRQDGVSRIIVTKVLKFLLWCIFRLNITDANTPYRLIDNQTLSKHIKDIPKEFNLSNVMLTVLLMNGKESIRFIPITFRERQGGVNSINLKRIVKIGIQAVKDFIVIKRTITNESEFQ